MAIVALYPGSFDPLTNGHVDIITRAARLVDRLIVAIGTHHNKSAFLPAETRKALIEAEIAQISGNIEVAYFDGLVVTAAQDLGAGLMIRGLRNGTDLDYEMGMAGMNGALAADVETVFLPASPNTGYISSSLVKQIARLGGDITSFVPGATASAVASALNINDKRT